MNIALIAHDKKKQKMIALCEKYKIPTVVIGKKVSNEFMGSIYVDAKKIAFELIDSFLRKGKKDVKKIIAPLSAFCNIY